ncbi:MAG: acetylglutamate kinase [Agathobaculum sp.]|uniref:acetylglutamate kinase n=1 Tax=Agathobaculum sp. TaxID=2048138 RepID=UPI0025B7B058|nr:acetylglutamate kinase [Agathobaculum sp.]MCI7125793.1 acetylglutamate kinase [Agathobaculum sp.]MDY3711399.1 acetylglutamate kinase [Agathobaculum sp.]
MDIQHDAELKARILVEALPFIQKYYGQTVVVKYGGNAMINEELKDAVIHDLVLLNLVGIKVVVVHGGGPEINEMLAKVGKEARFVNGLRYTDRETMDIVQMVLCGKVNKDLVTLLQKAGGRGIGLGGMDGGLFQARRMTDRAGTDYGYVGDIVDVDPAPVIDMLAQGYIPVVSTVARGIDDETNYNINADTAASKLAVALGAKKLILLTDVRGLMLDPKDDSTLLTNLKVSEVPKLMRDGVIKGGMIPKVDCCVEAVRKGVDQANIQDGRVKHSILIELLSRAGVGTMFQ